VLGEVRLKAHTWSIADTITSKARTCFSAAKDLKNPLLVPAMPFFTASGLMFGSSVIRPDSALFTNMAPAIPSARTIPPNWAIHSKRLSLPLMKDCGTSNVMVKQIY